MMRRRLGRDKLIGTGTIQIPSAVLRNKGLLAVQLLDTRGNVVGQVGQVQAGGYAQRGLIDVVHLRWIKIMRCNCKRRVLPSSAQVTIQLDVRS